MTGNTRTKRSNRISIADVAKRAGVSTATVSRVINQTGPVAPETLRSVKTAINELNYRPKRAAQALAGKHSNTIGLVISDIAGDFFSPMLRGIEYGVRENGYDLLIYSTQGNYVSGINAPLGDHNSDGLLVFVDSIPQSELAWFNRIKFPVVLIHQSPPANMNIASVTIENKYGAQRMMNHLIEVHGYRRIALLTGAAEQEDAHWRELGYRESLAAHNISFDASLVAEGGFSRDIAYTSVKKWLQNNTQFDAIFADDDESAIGALQALQEAGRRVPEDVAVVGFDDIPLARYLNPPLTTVRAPIEDVGFEAVRQLVRLIQTGKTDPLTLLPTELVIRRSCGCQGNNP
jgi:DNA-binding LacI/PurR family transcriptional regulator